MSLDGTLAYWNDASGPAPLVVVPGPASTPHSAAWSGSGSWTVTDAYNQNAPGGASGSFAPDGQSGGVSWGSADNGIVPDYGATVYPCGD